MIILVKNFLMNKTINKKNCKNEPWFKWLTRELNSYEAFQDFDMGKNPRDVAEDFISRIVSLFQKFSRILMKKIKIHSISFLNKPNVRCMCLEFLKNN